MRYVQLCEAVRLLKENEAFLLMYSGKGGRLLSFCAHTELELVHKSEYIVCDGTFEMCPDSAYQLYTLHGFNATCVGFAA